MSGQTTAGGPQTSAETAGHEAASVDRCQLRASLPLVLIALIAPSIATAQTDKPPTSNPAEDYVRRAHLKLVSRQSIRAEIDELVNLTDPPFHMTGTYISAGLRTRLNYSVALYGGAKGTLLEVCDGERLWSVTDIPGAHRVTRRDVRQILAAVQNAKAQPDRGAAVDLALGGMPALLASLQRSMNFDAITEETKDERKLVVVQGRWKSDFAQRMGADKTGGGLPLHIPDLTRIYFAADTSFPERVLYLKRPEEKKTYRPLIDLKFRNVVLDGPIDEKAFEYTPPATTR